MSNLFKNQLDTHGAADLRARRVTTLQVNMGKLCNQACRHCHVDAGPHQQGSEVNMGAEVASQLLNLLQSGQIQTLDLTGGAPELNPNFRPLVQAARKMGISVIDRCNLSVLLEPGQEDLATFLAEQGVEVSASLPHYSRERTDSQRGAGIHDRSIEALRLLNSLGYGDGRSGRILNLVYNPVGAFLPGDQAQLQADFKRELKSLFQVVFDQLFCITNMPINRYLDWLQASGNYEGYMQSLLAAYNPLAVEGLMCRELISVGPDGRLYDCDFNQMLGMGLDEKAPQYLQDFDLERLTNRRISSGSHCLGCTAGSGSSCRGALEAS
ncbi:MAG: arsenosugar biosynthesis radical SAM (seleno)protein ArsS [Planctomycetota bacterium]|jgi:radical SAM/Cys-rich protein